MFGPIILPEIKSLIERRDFAALRETFQEWPPADLAELIADLPEGDRVIVFRLLPHALAADVFEYLEVDAQTALLKAMAHEQAVAVLNEMSPDDRTALLEELPSAAVTQLLRLLTPEERAIAKSLLGYPENTVGRLMTPDFIAVNDAMTVREVLDYIRAHGQNSETLNVIYVVDPRRKLIDDIRIREILLKPLDCTVRDIRDESFVALKVTDLEADAVDVFRKYDRNTMPVVDSEGVLVGIVTIDDILDVYEEETTKDIHRIGGMEALDDSYMNNSPWRMVRKRAPWLVILMFGEMLTTAAMGHFEDEIARAVVLALFVPLIISSGGNSGSQASTLIIRAMALSEVRLRDWWRVMRRELLSGASLGLILGLIGFGKVAVISQFTNLYGEHWVLLGLAVGMSLAGVVLWGSLAGSMLPFLLRRLGLDPATSSAPFVATLVDVTGLMIYFTVAVKVLTGSIL